MQLAGVIEALSGSTAPEDAFALVCGAVTPLGYRWVGLFALTEEAAAAAGAASPIVMSNYPDGFVQSYLGMQRHAVDPVLALAADTITALLWEDVVTGKSLSAEQRAQTRQSGRAFLRYGGKLQPGGDRGQEGFEGRRGDERAAGGGDADGQNLVAVHSFQEGVDDAGLAGAGVAEQQDERPAGVDGVYEVGEGLALPGGGRGDGHVREPSSRRGRRAAGPASGPVRSNRRAFGVACTEPSNRNGAWSPAEYT